MAYSKTQHSPFFGKGLGNKLIGAGKGLSAILSEPLVQAGVSALSPELGVALGVAKRTGFLEKMKH